MRKQLGKIKKAFIDHGKNKYLAYQEIFPRFFKNRNMVSRIYSFSAVKQQFKKSDTIFILGNGPSLNLPKEKDIQEIAKHDVFGVSLSFLKKDIKPTFHQLALEADKTWRDPVVQAFAPYRSQYRDVIFFFSDKVLLRLGHPRLTPEFFPENPKCCLYPQPEAISLETNRPFQDLDFNQKIFYRGTLSLILSLAVKMGYKKIVLLGVDLNTRKHFYDDYPEMTDYCRRLYAFYESLGVTEKYESMLPKRDKLHPFDVYLYALNDYLIRKKSCEIFTGFKTSILYPKLKAYFPD